MKWMKESVGKAGSLDVLKSANASELVDEKRDTREGCSV